jgi:hypothetical protein
MHANFKSVKERFHANDTKEQAQRGAPGQYEVIRGNISSVQGNMRSRDTYFTHKSVFKSKIPRVKSPKGDDDRDTTWNLDKDKKKFWAPKDYSKFAHDARLSHINHKSACKTEYYELEKRCTLVSKYMPTAAIAGQRHSNLRDLNSGGSSSSGESRLFSKNSNGAMKAECLDLSGCELETCSEMSEVAQLCFDAARKSAATGSNAEKMTFALKRTCASGSSSGMGGGAAGNTSSSTTALNSSKSRGNLDQTQDNHGEARRLLGQQGMGDASFRKGPGGMGIGDGKKSKKAKVPMKVKAIRMANNKLASLNGLDESVEMLGLNCNDICWLDTSFNQITELSAAITKFPNLQSLTLTNNLIAKVSALKRMAVVLTPEALTAFYKTHAPDQYKRHEIIKQSKGSVPEIVKLINELQEKYGESPKYSGLKNLMALHLVGNPVTSVKNYRCQVIGLLPQLNKFDSIIITKKERDLGKYIVPKKIPRKREGD